MRESAIETESAADWLNQASQLPEETAYKPWARVSSRESAAKASRAKLEANHGAELDRMGLERYTAFANSVLNGFALEMALARYPPKGIIRDAILTRLERAKTQRV